MKIVVNGRCFNGPITGIAVSTGAILRNLANLGGETVLFTNNPKIQIPKVKILRSGWQVLGPFYDYFVFGLQTKGADIVFSPGNSGTLYSLSGTKISIIYDMSVFDRPKDHAFLNGMLIKMSILVAYWFSNVIITISQYSKKRIEEVLGSHKIAKTVYLGVNLDEIKGSLTILPEDKKTKGSSFIITTNATHPKRKNLPTLIKAIKSSSFASKITLVVTGINSFISQEGFIIQKGYLPRKEFFQTIAASDLFVYPSFYEGFGLPVLEAMACRVPVITSNNTSLPELLPDKKWLVDPNDIGDLARKIDLALSLSSQERQDLVRKNYNFAKNFTWEKTARQIWEIFKLHK